MAALNNEFPRVGGLTIVSVKQAPELIGRAAKWFHEKWGVPEQAYLDSMNESLTAAAVPAWYLALDADKNLCAGLGVIENDFHKRPDLTPNLCAVYVSEAYRGRGVARRLLDCACEALSKAGVARAYLITSHERFYERCGWTFFGMIEENDGSPIRCYTRPTGPARMSAEQMWERYTRQNPSAKTYEAWAFGTPDISDELACLTFEGTKTATASALIAYQTEGVPLPKVGCFSVVLDARGEAVCVIRDTKVSVVPFDEVSARHAYLEGEGDRSLDYWRRVHREAFAPDYGAAKLPFDEHGLCVLEEFERVY